LLAIAVVMTASSAVAARRSPAQVSGPAQGPSGFILGHVVESDSNAPVEGAVVTLTAWTDAAETLATVPPSRARGPAAAPPQSVLTTSEGVFLFRDLPAGRYSIAANANGHLGGGFLQNRPGGAARFIDLGYNDRRGGIRLVVWKFAAITGRVTDEHGDPAPDVRVNALQREMVSGRLSLTRAASAWTDDRGMYRIAGLKPGGYLVGVLPSVTTIPVTLAAELAAVASDAKAGLSLRGSRLLPTGIAIRDGSGMRVGDSVLVQVDHAVHAHSPDGDGRVRSYLPSIHPGTTDPGQAAVVNVGAGESRTGIDLAIDLVPTVRISGRVTRPDGPVPTLGLNLVPLSTSTVVDDFGYAPPGGALAATDASGAFTFLSVPAGQYMLKTSRVPSPADRETEPVLWGAQSITVGDADITDLVLAIRPGIRVSGRLEFSGAAARPASDVIQRMIMMLRPVGARMWRSGSANARADETFTTAGDPAGLYDVFPQLGPPGWTVSRMTLGGVNIIDGPIELVSSDLSDLVIEFTDKPPRISGTVVGVNGLPDLQADVIAFPADSAAWRGRTFGVWRHQMASVTSKGTFVLTGLPPGDYFVVAIDNRLADSAWDPAFQQRLVPGAVRVRIGVGEERTAALKTFAPDQR
jgi:hypothetical protein